MTTHEITPTVNPDIWALLQAPELEHKPMTSIEIDRQALRYAGLLGHEYAVVRTLDGERRLYAECPTLDSACHSANGLPDNVNPETMIYRKDARGIWVMV